MLFGLDGFFLNTFKYIFWVGRADFYWTQRTFRVSPTLHTDCKCRGLKRTRIRHRIPRQTPDQNKFNECKLKTRSDPGHKKCHSNGKFTVLFICFTTDRPTLPSGLLGRLSWLVLSLLLWQSDKRNNKRW